MGLDSCIFLCKLQQGKIFLELSVAYFREAILKEPNDLCIGLSGKCWRVLLSHRGVILTVVNCSP